MTCLQGHYLDFTSSRVIKTFELFLDLVMQFSVSFFFFSFLTAKIPKEDVHPHWYTCYWSTDSWNHPMVFSKISL